MPIIHLPKSGEPILNCNGVVGLPPTGPEYAPSHVLSGCISDIDNTAAITGLFGSRFDNRFDFNYFVDGGTA